MAKNHDKSRIILVIEGKQSDCLEAAQQLCSQLNTLHLEDTKKANKYLGQEFDAVIFETHNGFSPNAFGAVTGTIRGEGYLLLLKPDQWELDSYFLKRFDKLLKGHSHTTFIKATDCKKSSAHTTLSKPPTVKNTRKSDSKKCYATSDQEKAVNAIIKVVKGHRRRPLVITSNRGRGKSASLGIAAAELFHSGITNIIVCAPSKKTAAVVLAHAKDCDLSFYSPDDLQRDKPKADLLLIDEAAAIPIPLLTSFLKHYSRIVFATTMHGYEGSGRGFAINFHRILDSVTPDWKNCHLSQAIRWHENDSLEQFVFQSLMLNAELESIELSTNLSPENYTLSKLNKHALIEKPQQLNRIFSLLVNAHYQTKPSDFMQILDDASISIYVLNDDKSILAVALIIEEGNIDPQTAQHIFAGTRRLQGHLVAQSLAANVGIKAAPCLSGQRIMRIAVHPSIQGRGIGTALLSRLSEKIDADYLSTSFGATSLLVAFWEKNGFTPVYLSMKRDASSGTHSVLLLKAKNQQGLKLVDEAKVNFTKSFPHLLSDPFRSLEVDIALSFLNLNQQEERLTSQEKEVIQAFACQQRGYENSFYPIWKLVFYTLNKSSQISENDKKILLLKVLQKQSWQEVVYLMGNDITGKKTGLLRLRKAVSNLFHEAQNN